MICIPFFVCIMIRIIMCIMCITRISSTLACSSLGMKLRFEASSSHAKLNPARAPLFNSASMTHPKRTKKSAKTNANEASNHEPNPEVPN